MGELESFTTLSPMIDPRNSFGASDNSSFNSTVSKISLIDVKVLKIIQAVKKSF